MLDWHDPVVLEKGYIAVIKLNHVLAGLYIWETMLTADFELNVLRGKRPYRRTIWLYLGTRYTTLLSFIIFLVDTDSRVKFPCQTLGSIFYALTYISWQFASLLITLRVIAIWDRDKLVSSLAIGIWLSSLVLNIYGIGSIGLRGVYNPTLGTCIGLDLHKYLANIVVMLVVDVVLLISMLVGLLRYSNRSSTGLWHLLYQQCVIWLALAAISELPFMVLLIFNLNEAMNDSFLAVTMTIMSIGAARMYRSLFQHAFSTEYTSSKLPQVSQNNPQNKATNIHSHIHFASGAQSNETIAMSARASVFMATNHIQSEISPDISIAKDDLLPPSKEAHSPAPPSTDIEQHVDNLNKAHTI